MLECCPLAQERYSPLRHSYNIFRVMWSTKLTKRERKPASTSHFIDTANTCRQGTSVLPQSSKDIACHDTIWNRAPLPMWSSLNDIKLWEKNPYSTLFIPQDARQLRLRGLHSCSHLSAEGTLKKGEAHLHLSVGDVITFPIGQGRCWKLDWPT